MKRIILISIICMHMCTQSAVPEFRAICSEWAIKPTIDLFKAVRQGNKERVREAIKAGADVQAEIWDQQVSALHIVAIEDASTVAELLITYGAQVNVQTAYHGLSPLHIAAERNASKVAKVLIENGARVNVQNCNKKTPLHFAVVHKALSMVSLLVEHGAGLDVQDYEKNTPLHLAVGKNLLSVVSLLIERGANINMLNNVGYSPLDLAVIHNLFDIAELLIDKGANVNGQSNVDTKNLLSIAVKKQLSNMTELLIVNGAKIPNTLSDKDIEFLNIVIRNINQKRAEQFAVLSALSALEAKSAVFNKKNMPVGLLERLTEMFSSQRSLAPLPLVIAKRTFTTDQQ